MRKRGQADAETLFLFIEIVLGILVAGIFIYGAANFDSLSNVNKAYAQQDISLLAETLGAAPGEIHYEYTIKDRLVVKIEDEVTVTNKNAITDSFSYSNITFTKEQGEKRLSIERHG